MFACSNDDCAIESSSDREIRLSGSVSDVKTRITGPINSDFNENFSIGVYAQKGTWVTTPSDDEFSNQIATVTGAVGHAVIFTNGPFYYPFDASTLYFYAYAPFATETTPASAGVSPKVTHTIDGQQDVMWASGTGSKPTNSVAINPVLNFQHQLTQLQFTFKSGSSYPIAGNRVTSLVVKNQPNSLEMNVENGAIIPSGLDDFQAISTANQATGIEITNNLGTNAFSPVMVVPATSTLSYVFDITVKTATNVFITYSDVEATLTTVKGNAHMITFTFTETAISATATVADWVQGTGGSVTVL